MTNRRRRIGLCAGATVLGAALLALMVLRSPCQARDVIGERDRTDQPVAGSQTPGEEAPTDGTSDAADGTSHSAQTPSAPHLGRLQEAWLRDAEYEVGVVGQETFEQTLENMAAYAPLYARTYEADPATRTGPENAYLSKVVESRRYAKLVEDLGGSDADRCAEQLVQRLKEDVAKFARMKAEWKPDHEGGLFGEVGPRSDDSLEDQSDLPSALASRLYACQLLVGHFQVAQALPQVLAAVDVMEGSLLINWGAAMYACDKVLSAEPDAAMPPAQRAVREEYLAWKRALAKEDPERFRFFDYQTKEFPAYDSVARANERAAIMGLRVEKGKRPDVTVEYPPPITQLMPLAALSPTGPQQEVVAFARRFVDAGTQ